VQACRTVDVALSLHREGIWRQGASAQSFAGHICAVMKHGFSLKLWDSQAVLSVLQFSIRNNPSSATDFLSEFEQSGDGIIPSHLYWWARMFNNFKQDEELVVWLEREFCARYSLADRTNISLLSGDEAHVHFTLQQVMKDEVQFSRFIYRVTVKQPSN
jgi:hypothetical protein